MTTVNENDSKNVESLGKKMQRYNSNRNSNYVKNKYRSGWSKQNYSGLNEETESVSKAKTEETIEDIKLDIERIEKEIDFEIQEIKRLKIVF